MEPNSFSLYSCLAQARMVDVFPVPGGPYRRRCGRRSSLINFWTEDGGEKRDAISLRVASFTVGQSWAGPLQLYVQIQGTHKNEKSEGRSCQSHIPKSLIRFFKVITAETISLRNISRSFNENTSHWHMDTYQYSRCPDEKWDHPVSVAGIFQP